MKKILLCGPHPPPIGGISIHIERLSTLLTDNKYAISFCDESPTIKKDIYNIRTLNFFKYLSLMRNTDIVHIHSSIWIFRLIHILSAFIFRKKTIVTIHSWRSGSTPTFIWTTILNLLTFKTILVNYDIASKLKIKPAKRLSFPAFIPPHESKIDLPAAITEFIDNARRDSKLIACSNAFRITEHNQQDLYGLDLCISAFSDDRLIESYALVFSISDPSVNSDKIRSYQKIIEDKGLQNSIYLQLGAIDFYKLLMASDLSIRATNTDGDALSIRESLYLKRPCIASDCTNRPNGTILFTNRSVESLISSISTALPTELTYYNDSHSLEEIENFYLTLYSDYQ